jgi:hypothetical protein
MAHVCRNVALPLIVTITEIKAKVWNLAPFCCPVNFIFFKMGVTQPLHQRDAYGLASFHLFNKDGQKALHRSYKLKLPK